MLPLLRRGNGTHLHCGHRRSSCAAKSSQGGVAQCGSLFPRHAPSRALVGGGAQQRWLLAARNSSLASPPRLPTHRTGSLGPYNETASKTEEPKLDSTHGSQGFSIEQSAGLSASLARAAAETTMGSGPVGVLSREDLERLANMDAVLLPTMPGSSSSSSSSEEVSSSQQGHPYPPQFSAANSNGASSSSTSDSQHLQKNASSRPVGANGFSHSTTMSHNSLGANGVSQSLQGLLANESPGSSQQGVNSTSSEHHSTSHTSSSTPSSNPSSDPSSMPLSTSTAQHLSGSSPSSSSSSSSSSSIGPEASHAQPSQPASDASSPSTSSHPSTTSSSLPQPSPPQPTPHPNLGRPGHIPQSILVISLVSATLTMASCVFNTLLPIYMVTELRMSMRSMGMFEGLLEAFSYVVRMFSGVVSDMMTSRKSAITLGFAMGACAKFGMSGASTVGQLFASKAVDRLANGVQAAPRDALISDLAPKASRSACYGFAQSMRKWGSFVGAGLAFFLMKVSNNDYKLIFVMAATVSVASTLAFVTLVPSHAREQEVKEGAKEAQKAAKQQQKEQHASPAPAPAAAAQAPVSDAAAKPLQPGLSASSSSSSSSSPEAAQPQRKGFQIGQFCKDVWSMGTDFYRTLLVICLYGLGHINESMLEARAIEVGFGKAESTLVVALLALMIFFCAYPMGRLDDRYGPRVTFAVGMGALILGDLTLLMSGTHPIALFCSLLFLGVHWAVIQGPMLSIVVGLAPTHLRGTAFGIFYTVMACTAVTANTMFGSVWTALGANAVFGLSAVLMGSALVALPALLPATTQKPVVARA